FPRRWNRPGLDVELFPPLRHRWGNFFSNLPIEVTDIKRRLAGEQLVNACAKRVDVIKMAAALAFQLLRTHVSECAASAACHRYHAHRITQAAGNSKIGYFELAALIDHQISRL